MVRRPTVARSRARALLAGLLALATVAVLAAGALPVAAAGDYVTVSAPDRATAGEEVTIDVEISVPDVPGRDGTRNGTVTLEVDGREVDSRTVEASDGETVTVTFRHAFEDTGTRDVSATASVTVFGKTYSDSDATDVEVVAPEDDDGSDGTGDGDDGTGDGDDGTGDGDDGTGDRDGAGGDDGTSGDGSDDTADDGTGDDTGDGDGESDGRDGPDEGDRSGSGDGDAREDDGPPTRRAPFPFLGTDGRVAPAPPGAIAVDGRGPVGVLDVVAFLRTWLSAL
jgi:hypothetical protein